MEEAVSGEEESWRIASGHKREGRRFDALDVATEGLARFPDSLRLAHLRGLMLVNLGAIDEAARAVEPAVAEVERRLARGPSAEDVRMGPELFGLAGRIHKERFRRRRRREDLTRAAQAYGNAFERFYDAFNGINAAAVAWLSGERESAATLARKVLERSVQSGKTDDEYWRLVTRGEAWLYLGDGEAALAAYRQAVALERRPDYLFSSRRQLLLLQEHDLSVSADVLRCLAPGAVVAFSGHMLDAHGRKTPRFPAWLESAARRALDVELAALDVGQGYCSAACGGDLLFVEAMHARGAQVHIVMPFCREDFIQTSVAFAGAAWVARMDQALARAATVTYATEERFLGDAALFDYANRLLVGEALLEARRHALEPTLLALVEPETATRTGNTVSVLRRHEGRIAQRVLDIAKLRAATVPPAVAAPPPEPGDRLESDPRVEIPRRRLVSMLFADLKGYSTLRDEHFEPYLEFLRRLNESLEASARPWPAVLRTAGDGIFATADAPLELATWGFALQRAVRDANGVSGLPQPLQLRLALHSAPVFDVPDTLRIRPDLFGAHVNRAARLEPVTLPGEIYATSQFVALLAEASPQASLAFDCEYVGTLVLAKGFGKQRAYHLAERSA